MKHEEASFQGCHGLELYFQRWQADVEPRAVIVLVHGIGEHSGRYMNVVNPLVTEGYTVYGYDHRGHGRSPGQRVFINHWGEYREDLRAFVDTVRQEEPGKPIFLYAHSMGGLIALDYLLYYPQGLRGAIISSALIVPPSKPHLVLLARALSGVWPRFSLKTGLDPRGLSRDPQVIKAGETDPLSSNVATVRWGTEMFKTVSWVKSHAKEISLPILLIHGDADWFNGVEGSRYLFDAITHADKTLIIYPGGYHESHNDIDHEKVLTDVKGWLDRHLAPEE
jgi:alpha-beta hydrolase superfamily lysophospholipase